MRKVCWWLNVRARAVRASQHLGLAARVLCASLVLLFLRQTFGHRLSARGTVTAQPRAEEMIGLQRAQRNDGPIFSRDSRFAMAALASPAALFANMLAAGDTLPRVPEGYPTLAEFEQRFEKLARAFPALVRKHVIGKSHAQRPIVAYRLSAHPEQDEDEPAVLVTALHHAREPVGVFICAALMEDLLQNYGKRARQTRFVDSLDIWLVPLVNPDGYEYLMTQQREFPWWRKNLRDNNHDGKFDPRIDGVDLNRNYDYNWNAGGEGAASSWYYRGPEAFSEPETQALRALAAEHHFVLGVALHSYGEAVLYPWGNFAPPPDEPLLLAIAQAYAAQIGRLRGGKYHVLPLDGRAGQSSVWWYGTTSAMDFICEVAEDYFPPLELVPKIVAENLRGVDYLLARALRSGVAGHVRDAQTGAPLAAEIVVAGLERAYVKPRRAHGVWGRFERLLLPGRYNLCVRQEGYRALLLQEVSVNDSTLTYLEVELQREAVLPSSTSH